MCTFLQIYVFKSTYMHMLWLYSNIRETGAYLIGQIIVYFHSASIVRVQAKPGLLILVFKACKHYYLGSRCNTIFVALFRVNWPYTLLKVNMHLFTPASCMMQMCIYDLHQWFRFDHC